MGLLAKKTLTGVQRHEFGFPTQPLATQSTVLAVSLMRTRQIANIHEPFNSNTSECGRRDGPDFRYINP